MGSDNRAILVLHDGDPVGRAVATTLQAAGTPVRQLSADDDLATAALGCRHVIAVGDRFAADGALLGACNLPGVGGLVLVVFHDVDLRPLRTRGIPYTVLRVAPILEDIVAALTPLVAAGRIIVDNKADPPLSFVAARDVAQCAVAAIDDPDACGRLVHVAAPARLPVSELARRTSLARGANARVTAWPRWALAALRAVGKRPLRLPPELAIERFPADDVGMLHPGPWRTVDEVAADLAGATFRFHIGGSYQDRRAASTTSRSESRAAPPDKEARACGGNALSAEQ